MSSHPTTFSLPNALTVAGTPSTASVLASRYLESLNKAMQTPAYTHKRDHHYISQCVQRSFAVDSGQKKTWRLSLQHKLVEEKSISGILFEPYIYRGTGRFGPDDARLEEVFAVIESAAAPALSMARDDPRRFIEDVRHSNSLNRFKISMLLASLGLRSPLLQSACQDWALTPEQEEKLLQAAEEKFGVRVPQDCRLTFIEDAKSRFEWKDGILDSLSPVADDFFLSNWHFLLIPEKVRTAFVLPDGIAIFRTVSHLGRPEVLFPLTPKLALSLGSRLVCGIEHVDVTKARQLNEELVSRAKRYVIGTSEAQLKSLMCPR